MTSMGPYRDAQADTEPEPLEVTELRRRIEELDNTGAAFNYPGGRRGIEFEIDCLRERIDEILAEVIAR